MSVLSVTILLPSKSSPVMFVNVLWQSRKLLTGVIHPVIACSTHFSCLLKNTSTHLPSLTRLSSLAPKIYFPCSYNYHREEEKKCIVGHYRIRTYNLPRPNATYFPIQNRPRALMYTGRRGRLYWRCATIALNDLFGERDPLFQYVRMSITVGQESEDAVGDGPGTKSE